MVMISLTNYRMACGTCQLICIHVPIAPIDCVECGLKLLDLGGFFSFDGNPSLILRMFDISRIDSHLGNECVESPLRCCENIVLLKNG